jgi:hypothetical protein
MVAGWHAEHQDDALAETVDNVRREIAPLYAAVIDEARRQRDELLETRELVRAYLEGHEVVTAVDRKILEGYERSERVLTSLSAKIEAHDALQAA